MRTECAVEKKKPLLQYSLMCDVDNTALLQYTIVILKIAVVQDKERSLSGFIIMLR